jgi:hypothetical protein
MYNVQVLEIFNDAILDTRSGQRSNLNAPIAYKVTQVGIFVAIVVDWEIGKSCLYI